MSLAHSTTGDGEEVTTLFERRHKDTLTNHLTVRVLVVLTSVGSRAVVNT